MPNPEALEKLRQADPRMYKIWVDLVTKRIHHDMWMEKAPYQLPYRLASRGQIAAIIGLVVVAVLCAYAIYLDHPWVAAFLGSIDMVGIIAAFAGAGDGGGGDGSHRGD